MAAPSLNPLVDKVRGAHPGAYDDMDDAALTKAVLAKYPQYEDLARPATPMPGSPATQPMHQSALIGDPDKPTHPPLTEELGDIGKGFVHSLADVSAPILAHRIGQRVAPKMIPRGDIYSGEGQLKDVPEKATIMTVGGMEAGPEGEIAPRASVPAPTRIVPPIMEDAAPGVAMRVGKVLAHKIPGVKLASDLADAVRGPETKPTPNAPAVPIPETNGIQWGTGGDGPLDLRGQRIQSPDEAAPSLDRIRDMQPQPTILDRLRNQPIPPEVNYTPNRPSIERILDTKSEAAPAMQPGAAGSLVQSILSPIERAPEQAPATYPLDRAPLTSEGPIPGSKEDLAESKAIQERIRDAGNMEDQTRLRLAREERGRIPTKGELIERAGKPTARAGKPAATAKVSSSAGVDLPGIAVTDDLTPEWQKALDDLKAKKASRGN